jgi:hypothetical protein
MGCGLGRLRDVKECMRGREFVGVAVYDTLPLQHGLNSRMYNSPTSTCHETWYIHDSVSCSFVWLYHANAKLLKSLLRLSSQRCMRYSTSLPSASITAQPFFFSSLPLSASFVSPLSSGFFSFSPSLPSSFFDSLSSACCLFWILLSMRSWKAVMARIRLDR